MKKIHNLLLASILCIGTQSALANTDNTSTDDVSSTTVKQLVVQLQSLSIEDLQELKKALRAQFESDHQACKNIEKDDKDASREERKESSVEKNSDKRDAKKCYNKKDMNNGKMKHRQKASMEKAKFEKWISILFDKYHAQQHNH